MPAFAARCFRHAPLVVLLWLVLLTGLLVAAGSAGSSYRDELVLPSADSTVAAELAARVTPGGDQERVLLGSAREPVDAAVLRDRVEPMLAELSRLPRVVSVDSPYTTAGLVSADRRVAVAVVRFDAGTERLGRDLADRLVTTARSAEGDGLTVGVAGPLAASAAGAPSLGNAALGLLAAGIVLLVTFGSLTCVLLPIITASVSVGAALAVISLLGKVVTVPGVSTEIAALLGLGVGVDYALFVLTRYRQALADGRPTAEALAVAAATSGRSVVFAGLTVCVSLLGMFTVGIGFLNGIALSAVVAVLLTMLASLSLLPALLRFAGHRARPAPGRAADGAGWARLARAVTAHPVRATAGALVVVGVLAAPMFALRLGLPDAGADPQGSATRVAFDLQEKGFGPGANGPLVVAGRLHTEGDRGAVLRLREEVSARAEAGPPVFLPDPEGGTVALLTVIPRGSPQDESTTELVHWLRDTAIPAARADGEPAMHVGGVTAAQADFSAAIADRLPLFLTSVVAISVLLLAALFRSVLIPLTAALMNLLAAAATIGVVVAVFGLGLFGGAAGPIEPYLPVFLFAGLFGLSLDYEVFLVTRIQEEWRRRGDTRAAIVAGLAGTGRTITAAALIMALVFVSFVFAGSRVVRESGVGLTVAVLLDAVVIRCALVPAVMVVLGRANWWLPGRRPIPARGDEAVVNR
ncbi:MMPL family transporter [Amycolatopsis nigrescens]|uniref:MMPL family transporter n=1 Tax=Amycolatopsis nigrescens TaxID=381445 RepID=UPI00036AF4F4|nr:MMPL family transporter [Amycolatopsis nigrescens]